MSTRLETFRVTHGLTYVALSDLCGGTANGANRTAIRLICQGRADAGTVKRLQPKILDSIEAFCRRNALDLRVVGAIRAEMDSATNTQTNLKGALEMLPPVNLSFECRTAFGMNRNPFELEVLPEEVFRSPELDDVFNQILRAVETKGFIAVLGETGSGKSVMQTRLAEYADDPQRKTHLVKLEADDMSEIRPCHISGAILRYFDQKVPSDRAWRTVILGRTLKGAFEQKMKIAVSIDDCHATSGHLMVTLKRINEIGSVGRKYLAVLLWGQLSFERKLIDPRYSEIRQRLTILKMPSMSNAARDYLASRLQLAGASIDRVFAPEAVSRLSVNYPTPLSLNNAAAHAILTAWQRGADRVLPDFVFVPNEPRVTAIRQAAAK